MDVSAVHCSATKWLQNPIASIGTNALDAGTAIVILWNDNNAGLFILVLCCVRSRPPRWECFKMLSSTLPNHSSSSRMNAKARQANPGVHGLNMSCWCKYKAVWLAGRPGTRHFGQHMLAHAEKESSEAQPWEKPIFGVPMAPTEIWQGFAQEHRCLTCKFVCDTCSSTAAVQSLPCRLM